MRGIQNEHQQDEKQGTELHEKIRAQIACVLELAPV
jgi:hypothetical protein